MFSFSINDSTAARFFASKSATSAAASTPYSVASEAILLYISGLI